MSLRISDFDQFELASDRIDYISLRLSEQKVITLSILNEAKTAPVDITGWVWSVVYFDAIGTFTEGSTTLTGVTNVTLLSNSPQTAAGLGVTVINATGGIAALTIPSAITSVPAVEVTLDSANTLLKLIKMTATYPSGSVSGFNIIDQYQVGVIIRFGG